MFARKFALGPSAVSLLMVLASCGGGDSGPDSARSRNSALPVQEPFPVSCAQLVREPVTETTDVVRFDLCDSADLYSVVTPTGVDGGVSDVIVSGGESVDVPLSPEVDGASTRLIVHTTDAVDGDPWLTGVHIYDISLATVGTDMADENDPIFGTVYVKVAYDMPPPHPLSAYTTHSSMLAGGRDEYMDYVSDYVNDWAKVRLSTCYSLPTDLDMSVLPNKGVLSYAMLQAKMERDRDWYVSLNTLRYAVDGYDRSAALCPEGTEGFNLFMDGVTRDFQPLTVDELAESTDVQAIARTYALLDYWIQVKRNDCAESALVNSDAAVVDLENWRFQSQLRMENLAGTDSQAVPAAAQMGILAFTKSARISADASDTCTVLPAGYEVVSAQSALPEETTTTQAETTVTVEETTTTVADQTTSQSEQATTTTDGAVSGRATATTILAGSTTAAQTQATVAGSATTQPESLAAIAASAPSAVTVPAGNLAWTGVSLAPSARVGEPVPKTRILAASGLASTPKSKVTLKRTGSSPKTCKYAPWGVRGTAPGTCRVRVTVATPGKKSRSATVDVTIEK